MKKRVKKLVLTKETLRSLEWVRGSNSPTDPLNPNYTKSCGPVCPFSAPTRCPNQDTAGTCTQQ
jgi:hypothetical protein